MQRPHESAREVANGKWAGILGRWLDERALSGRHTKCPMCGGKDRWRFDNKGGDGTWFCNQCGAGDGFHLLMGLLGMEFKEAANYVGQVAGKIKKMQPAQEINPEEARAALRRMWEGASPVVDGDPVSIYLKRRCGDVPVPSCIRYHPSIAYKHSEGETTKHPAMVARVVGADGTPLSIHRTYLTREGTKAELASPKKLMTPTSRMDNVSIRLGKPTDGWLGVAEGIETALCASVRFSVPVWACISAGMMETFRPPAGVKMLTIFGDNDKTFVGQASAYRLARILSAAGIECNVVIPDVAGADWADRSVV